MIHHHPPPTRGCAMKFIRRSDLEPQTRIDIVRLAWQGQGIYGKMTQLARAYHISRTFLYQMTGAAYRQLEILFSDSKDLVQAPQPLLEPLDIIGDSVYLFHANLFDLTRQTARVLGCDQPDARRVRPCAASLCCGLCCPLSARQDLGRQGASTPERRRRQRHFVTDARQAALHPRLPEDQSAANYARLAI